MAEQLATIEKVFLLQSVELFTEAAPEELLHLAHIALEEEHREGQKIYVEGDSPNAFYILVRGRVHLKSRREQHEEEAIEHQAFGVLSVLVGEPHLYTASCLEDCLVLRVDAEEFFDHVADDVDMMKGIIRYLARHIRKKEVF